jgi:hypothetical protein
VPRLREKIPKEGPQALTLLQILHLPVETQRQISALYCMRGSLEKEISCFWRFSLNGVAAEESSWQLANSN